MNLYKVKVIWRLKIHIKVTFLLPGHFILTYSLLKSFLVFYLLFYLLLLNKSKIYLLLFCVHWYFAYTVCLCGVSSTLELTDSCELLSWMLGIESRSPGRGAGGAINRWAISSDHLLTLLSFGLVSYRYLLKLANCWLFSYQILKSFALWMFISLFPKGITGSLYPTWTFSSYIRSWKAALLHLLIENLADQFSDLPNLIIGSDSMLPSSGILAGAAHLFFSPTSRWQQTFPPRGSRKLKLTGLTVLPSVLRDHIRRRRWERSLTWGANGALHFCTASLSVYKKESGQACRMGFPAGTQSHNDLILFYK